MNVYKDRLNKLRQVLTKQKIDAFILPLADMWNSEHPDDCDQRLEYICGLRASAGFAVITQNHATILIDARYSVTAKKQIDTEIFDIDYYTKTSAIDYAISLLDHGNSIGYDAWLHTKDNAKIMQKAVNDANIILTPLTKNPVDLIWNDRPAATSQIAIHHDIQYSGKTSGQKLNDVASTLDKNDCESLIITAPDSISWLLNLRTLENPQSPTVKGFAIIEPHDNRVTLFTDCDCGALNHSESDPWEIDILPIDEFPMSIHHFEQKEQIIQISNTSPDWFTAHLNAPTSEIIECDDPCLLLKSIKNPVEQDGIRASHKRDAIAVKNTIKWIKKTIQPSEIDISNKLIEERKLQPDFRGTSFDSIVGWNENGAAIHGKPTDTIIKGDGLILIDSGAQYDDGTTDITRTIAMGNPSQNMREKYTLVLKSHIALASSVFPQGVTGAELDAIARKPLWDHGLDYAHGTGHGVGHFLNVHEGPCHISPRGKKPLEAGMLLSIEPGYYKEDAFGIRLENLVLVQKYKNKDDANNEKGKDLLHFETVTMVPFEENCIMREMLSEAEQMWLDEYHAQCDA